MNRRGFLGLLATAPVAVPMASHVMPAPAVARQAAKVANFGHIYVGGPLEYITISWVKNPADPHARVAKTLYSEKELTALANRHTMGCKMNGL